MQRAQAAVEFALVFSIAMVVLFVAAQFGLLGLTYLSLIEVNDQGVRYAAIHSDCDGTSCTGGEQSVNSYMLSIGSPLLTQSGGSNLTIAVSPAAPRTYGQNVTVAVTFAIPSTVLFLPNPFLGIKFPTSFNSSESAFSEGN